MVNVCCIVFLAVFVFGQHDVGRAEKMENFMESIQRRMLALEKDNKALKHAVQELSNGREIMKSTRKKL